MTSRWSESGAKTWIEGQRAAAQAIERERAVRLLALTQEEAFRSFLSLRDTPSAFPPAHEPSSVLLGMRRLLVAYSAHRAERE